MDIKNNNSIIGHILCLCNKHDVVSYIPTVGGRELDVKIMMNAVKQVLKFFLQL